MFKSIELENFKGFKKRKVDIAKLTILTGANSSGKSALTNSILSIFQSDIFKFELSINGKYVNLGDYNDVINNRDSTKDLSFSYEIEIFQMVFNVTSIWELDKLRRLPKLKNFNISSKCVTLTAQAKLNNIYDIKITYDPIFDNLSPLDNQNEKEFEETRNTILSTLLKRKDFDSEIFTKVVDEVWHFEHTINNKDNELITYALISKIPYQIFRVLALNHFGLQNITRKISFIGSLRNGPERTYYETSKSDINIGPAGENFSDLIVLWQSFKDPKLKELIKITKKLNLASDIKANRITGGRYEIQIKPKKSSPFSSLNDVGFGLSQFLPIIVSDIEKGKGSTLFIAQPETHLHPSIQADFCDYLISQIDKNKKSYFIETHSEYLLNRLRLNIVNGTIDPKNVKVYYLINHGDDTEVHDIIFTKNGAIKNAPDEFFKTYLMDTMDIAMSSMV